MTTLFFIIGIIFAIYEFTVFINPHKELDLINKVTEDKNYFAADNPNVPKDERNQGCILVFIQLFYFTWSIIGLCVSTQWKLFAIMLAIGLVHGFFSKVYKKLKIDGGPIHLFTKRVDSIICCLLLFEIVFVHFHDFSVINYLLSFV